MFRSFQNAEHTLVARNQLGSHERSGRADRRVWVFFRIDHHTVPRRLKGSAGRPPGSVAVGISVARPIRKPHPQACELGRVSVRSMRPTPAATRSSGSRSIGHGAWRLAAAVGFSPTRSCRLVAQNGAADRHPGHRAREDGAPDPRPSQARPAPGPTDRRPMTAIVIQIAPEPKFKRLSAVTALPAARAGLRGRVRGGERCCPPVCPGLPREGTAESACD